MADTIYDVLVEMDLAAANAIKESEDLTTRLKLLREAQNRLQADTERIRRQFGKNSNEYRKHQETLRVLGNQINNTQKSMGKLKNRSGDTVKSIAQLGKQFGVFSGFVSYAVTQIEGFTVRLSTYKGTPLAVGLIALAAIINNLSSAFTDGRTAVTLFIDTMTAKLLAARATTIISVGEISESFARFRNKINESTFSLKGLSGALGAVGRLFTDLLNKAADAPFLFQILEKTIKEVRRELQLLQLTEPLVSVTVDFDIQKQLGELDKLTQAAERVKKVIAEAQSFNTTQPGTLRVEIDAQNRLSGIINSQVKSKEAIFALEKSRIDNNKNTIQQELLLVELQVDQTKAVELHTKFRKLELEELKLQQKLQVDLNKLSNEATEISKRQVVLAKQLSDELALLALPRSALEYRNLIKVVETTGFRVLLIQERINRAMDDFNERIRLVRGNFNSFLLDQINQGKRLDKALLRTDIKTENLLSATIDREIQGLRKAQFDLVVEVAKAKDSLISAFKDDGASFGGSATPFLQAFVDSEAQLVEIRARIDELAEPTNLSVNVSAELGDLVDAEIQLMKVSDDAYASLLRLEGVQGLPKSFLDTIKNGSTSIADLRRKIKELSDESTGSAVHVSILKRELERLFFVDVEQSARSIADISSTFISQIQKNASAQDELIRQQIEAINKLKDNVLEANADIVASEERKLGRLIERRRQYANQLRDVARLEFAANAISAIAQAAGSGPLAIPQILALTAALISSVAKLKSVSVLHTGTEEVKANNKQARIIPMRNNMPLRRDEVLSVLQIGERVFSKKDNLKLKGLSNSEVLERATKKSYQVVTVSQPTATASKSEDTKLLRRIHESLDNLNLKVSLDSRGFSASVSKYGIAQNKASGLRR